MATNLIAMHSISPDADVKGIPDYPRTEMQIDAQHTDMSLEMNRIMTFAAWPKPNVFPTTSMFVCAGFYYSGRGDLVVCFSCEGEISDWDPRMKPDVIHVQRFPNCLLVQGSEKKNKPFQPAPEVISRVAEYFKKKDPTAEFLFMKHGGKLLTNPHGMTTPKAALSSGGTDDFSSIMSSLSLNNPSNTVSTIPVMPQGNSDSSDMRHEQSRLDTLIRSWPKPEVVGPEDLARAGMYYIGPGDRVQCAFCKGKLEGWVRGDVPLAEHRKHFGSRCRFIQGQGAGVGNIPIVRSDARPDARPTSIGRLGPVSASGLGGTPTRVLPLFPTYAVLASREATFASWPSTNPQSINGLARAGFFFTGQGDMVKCFFCAGVLNDWRQNDDPWIEHAHWFPHCGYVRQVKGEVFIQTAVDNYTDILNAGGHRRDNINHALLRAASNAQSTDARGNCSVPEIMASAAANTLMGDMGLQRADVEKAAHIWASRNTVLPDANQLAELTMNIKDGLVSDVPSDTSSATPANPTPAAPPTGNGGMRQSPTPPGKAAMMTAPTVTRTPARTEPSEPTAARDEEREGSSSLEAEPGVEQGSTGKSKSQRKKKKKNKSGANNMAVISETAASSSPTAEESGDAQNINEKAEKLMREYTELQEQRLCKVCLDEEINIVFLPCGHLVCCAMCAPALTKCPICRGSITDVVRTYLS